MSTSKHYFDNAEKLNSIINHIVVMILTLSILGIFTNGMDLFIYALLAFILQTITWYLSYKKSVLTTKAISSKRLETLKNIIDEEIFAREFSYYDTFQDNTNERKDKPILLAIQENSFWNAQLYYLTFQSKLIKLFIYSIAALIIIAALYTSVKDGGDYQYSRAIFAILAINNIYTLISDIIGLSRCYQEMRKIDDFISSNKNNPNDMITFIYSRYEYEISIAPAIPDKIYEKHTKEISLQWRNRIINSNRTDAKKILSAILTLIEKCIHIEEPWAITGSANRYLLGVQSIVNDIDIITTQEGANQIKNALQPTKENNRVEMSTLENIRSYYFNHTIDGIRIEVMGDPENYNGLEWAQNNFWKDSIQTITLDETEVFSMNLQYEKHINQIIGNRNAFSSTK